MSITDIIAPEIKDDEFHSVIMQVAQDPSLKHVLEIGSSSGQGSTDAWVQGLMRNPSRPMLYCLEVSLPRFEALRNFYRANTQVKCFWASSVALNRFPSKDDIRDFYSKEQSKLRQWPVEEILGWLEQDINYVASSGAPQDGIRIIKKEMGIDTFDAVLIDGSEFTGDAEFADVYGAKYLLLDDIMAHKNFYPCKWLSQDPTYELIAANPHLRNGYAVFRKRQ